MKLTDLKETVSGYVSRKKEGKKVSSKKVREVLSKLERKQKIVDKEYEDETSAKKGSRKEIDRLELQRKVLNAQMKKARKLLGDID